MSGGGKRIGGRLDNFDKRLLELVQRDNQQTLEMLSEKLCLSATAVRRRLKRLRDNGTIINDVALIDPARVGITVIVSIRFEKESHATYEAFKQRMRAAHEVTQCYTVSGDVDFIVVVHLPDLKSYDAWVGEHLLSDQAIARSTANIVYTRVKFDTAIPIPSG